MYADKDVNILPEIVPTASDYLLIVRDGVWYRAKVSNVAAGGSQKLPAPASLNTEVVSSTVVFLFWSQVSGNSGYVVERSTNGTTWTQIASTANNVNEFNATGLTSGTVYYFRVKSKGNGALFTDSDWKQVNVTTP